MTAPAPVAAVALRARGVRKTFRRGTERVRALRGVDLDLPCARVVGLAGSSGSGKTTLLAVLCGWEIPDEGTVQYLPLDPAAAPRTDVVSLAWEDLALVPQTLGLLEDLTTYENVLLPARLTAREQEFRDRAGELMERLGVGHLRRRFPDQVSLGEQQRVALARALLLRPRVLLADEPTAHQDEGWADAALDLVVEHARSGGAALLISHHRQALDRADGVLVLRDGGFVEPAP